MNSELVSLVANIALTLSVIVAVIFGIAQVKTANKDRRERLTVETLKHFQTREFAEMLHFMHEFKFPADYEEWKRRPENDQIRLIQLSQEMESLGLLVAEGLIDIELVDKTLGSFVTSTWEKYKPVMFDMRGKTNDPFLAEYFQWLASRLTERMSVRPRKPFYESL